MACSMYESSGGYGVLLDRGSVGYRQDRPPERRGEGIHEEELYPLVTAAEVAKKAQAIAELMRLAFKSKKVFVLYPSGEMVVTDDPPPLVVQDLSLERGSIRE